MSISASPQIEETQTFGLKDFLGYFCFRLLVCAVHILSLERCDRYCRILARVLCKWIPVRQSLIRENLQMIFPEWQPRRSEQVTEKMWRHLLLMACEIAQAPRKVHRENWHEHFHIPDRRSILRIVMDTRPTVLVSAHFGNFELAGFLTGLFGVATTTVARPLDNGFVHNYITQFRSLGGQYFLPKEGSSPQIQELLSNNGNLTLLADQHAGPKGCWVDFLGKPASCHKGLALFTLSSGAPMIICCNIRTSGPLSFEMAVLGIADPLDGGEHLNSVASLTRWYNQRLETMILLFPEQYWWVHRRWRDPPPQRRSSKAA